MRVAFVTLFCVLAVMLALNLVGIVRAADLPACVIKGRIAHVRDGDTVDLAVTHWNPACGPLVIRIAGIDAPESLPRFAAGKCKAREVAFGLKARQRARGLLPVGAEVTFLGAGNNDRYNRLLGDFLLPDGSLFGPAMINQGLARPYGGEAKRNWCK